jgi:hypothetical protein
MWNPLRRLFISKEFEQAEAEVQAEMKRIEGLSAQEAEREASAFVRREVAVEDWSGPPPPAIEAQLATLHEALAGFLRRHRRYVFSESGAPGTIISAEDLIHEVMAGMRRIGGDGRDDVALGVRPGGPTIYEVADGKVRAEYASIFHYILLCEGDDYDGPAQAGT